MTLIDFDKKELLEIYRALEYKRWEECSLPLNKKTEAIHKNLTQLMEKVSQARKMCTCKENVSEWTFLLLSESSVTPLFFPLGMIVTP